CLRKKTRGSLLSVAVFPSHRSLQRAMRLRLSKRVEPGQLNSDGASYSHASCKIQVTALVADLRLLLLSRAFSIINPLLYLQLCNFNLLEAGQGLFDESCDTKVPGLFY